MNDSKSLLRALIAASEAAGVCALEFGHCVAGGPGLLGFPVPVPDIGGRLIPPISHRPHQNGTTSTGASTDSASSRTSGG